MARPPAPRAERRPHPHVAHGDTREDDYYWLRDADDPAVLAYLRAENDYADAAMAASEPLRQRLFEELVGHIQLTQESAPVPHGPFEYYSRTEAEAQYVWHCRRPRGGGPETVLLDQNALAAGHEFLKVGDLEVSPDHGLLAYTVDTSGGERYEVRVRDLASGADIDTVPNAYYGIAWANDGRTLLYVRPDDVMRPHQVWRHTVGTNPHDDTLVWEEPDPRFDVWLGRSRSGRVIVFGSSSRITSESLYVPADDPAAPARVIVPRVPGVTYHAEHRAHADGDHWLIVTDAMGATNSMVVRLPVGTEVATEGLDEKEWVREAEVVVPHSDAVRIEDINAFAGCFVVSERHNGLQRLSVHRDHATRPDVVAVPEVAYSIWLGDNREYGTTELRVGYSSLVRPRSVFAYDTETRRSTRVWEEPVLGGFAPERYVAEREWATASDGTRIPISVVRRNDVVLDGTAPLLLYGYGSYESSVDPEFAVRRLPLLDRGVIFAIAHVRGGGEMGRHWWLDGQLERKPNTFTDFVAAAEHLVARRYTSVGRIVARGRSAGGLLMGAAMNLRPDLWRGVVAEVPFVDVITTMSDPSIPLTVNEWEEWGNPDDPAIYRVMRTYSPYDNVRATDYPDVLVLAGLHDPRVQYWEPAKLVARLRATTTGGEFLLRTDLGAGHMGPSGRFDAWREEALTLAWILTTMGITA